MAQPGFIIEDRVDEWVESRLVPGQSKSEWYRYAVTTIMQSDPQLDKLYEPYEYEKRQEFVEKAVQEKIESVQNDIGRPHDDIVDNDDE